MLVCYCSINCFNRSLGRREERPLFLVTSFE